MGVVSGPSGTPRPPQGSRACHPRTPVTHEPGWRRRGKRKRGLGHVRVVVGGIVPGQDEPELLAAGVSRVFHPGSAMEEIVGAVAALSAEARAAQGEL